MWRKEKLTDLQLQLLKIQIYRTKLERRKLELELGLGRNDFTFDISVDMVDVEEIGDLN